MTNTESTETLSTLRESLKFYQDLVETSQDLIFQCDAEGRYTYLNPAWETTFGYTLGEMLGKRFTDFQTPEMAMRDTTEYSRLMKGNQIKGYETVHLGKGGKEIALIFNSKFHLDAKGQIVGTQGTAIDITERKLINKKLEESEQTFRKLFEDSLDAILLINNEGLFVECNQAALTLLQMTREEFILLSPAKISPEFQEGGERSEDMAITYINLAYQKGHHRFDWICLNSKGEEFSVEVSLMPILIKGETFLHTTWRDITKRKEMEKALRESEYFFIESQKAARIGSYQSEFYPNDIWKTSKVCDEIFGMDENYNKTVQGWIDLLHPEDAKMMTDYVTNDVIGKGVSFDKEYRICRQTDGATRWVWGRGETIIDKTGRTTGLIGTIQDVTDRKEVEQEKKQLQEQLHQSQKMEAIGQIAGGVAHDFNNVLAGIVGATELLLSNFSTQVQKEYLEMILTSCERAASMTQKLLLFARKKSKEFSTVACLKIVEETIALLKHTIDKNISINLHNYASELFVEGDASLLQNVFMNIAINASQAMSGGGELTFSLRNIELGADYPHSSSFEIRAGHYLEISISDTGSGMSPEVQSHIFEPFYTTKEVGKGTGLGLSMVYGTIQELGGAIEVHSEMGVGTTFRIYLPVRFGASVSAEQPKDEVKGRGTILLIDDEELVRATTAAILEHMGYSVIVASNGEEGIKKFQEQHNKIDLILLDMVMPVMGGRETFIKIRRIDSQVPIVIASGFSKEEELADLKSWGANEFLTKPYRKAELAKVVEKLLVGSFS